jgi:hypothetical protein
VGIFHSKNKFSVGDLVTGEHWSVYNGGYYIVIEISDKTFNDAGDPLHMIVSIITWKKSPAWPVSILPVRKY